MPRKIVRKAGTRTYQNYNPKTLEKCLKTIKLKLMTTCCFKTLQNTQINYKKQIKKYPQQYNNVGRPTVFSREEESSFAQHCITLANFGFPIISIDLKMTIRRYLDSKGAHIQQFKNNTPGDDCVNGFFKRHQMCPLSLVRT